MADGNGSNGVTVFDQDAFYREVLIEKYCKDGESAGEEIFQRVARALAANDRGFHEKWEPNKVEKIIQEQYLDVLRSGFIPGSRIASACGTEVQTTLIFPPVFSLGEGPSEPVMVTVQDDDTPAVIPQSWF